MAASCSTIVNAPFLHRHQPGMTMHSLKLSKQATSFFGLKSNSCRNGVTMMASYKVTLLTIGGTEEFECPDDVYIFEQADDLGIVLPASCRSGACSSCVGKVKSGTVDQSDGNFLDEKQKNSGWVLTCVAYPTSDVVIQTSMEEELFD